MTLHHNLPHAPLREAILRRAATLVRGGTTDIHSALKLANAELLGRRLSAYALAVVCPSGWLYDVEQRLEAQYRGDPLGLAHARQRVILAPLD